MKYEELKDLLEEFISCEMTCKGWRDCEGCEEDINELINTVREVIEPEIRKQAQKESYQKVMLWLEEHKFCNEFHQIKIDETDSYFEETCLMQVWKKCKEQLKGDEK